MTASGGGKRGGPDRGDAAPAPGRPTTGPGNGPPLAPVHGWRSGPGPEERRRLKAYNVALATGGHLLALVLLLVLDGTGTSHVDFGRWLVLVSGMAAVQGTLWLAARRGWDEALPFDRHFLHVPILVSGLLFAAYIHMAPAARYLLLMAWFVALLFAVGRLGFREVAGLSTVMAALYLGTVGHLVGQGHDLSLVLETVHAGVFLSVNLYAGAVFERLRTERRETRALRRSLAEQAITDPLTGLPNRRYLEELLEAELGRIRRYGGTCSVAMVDVDDFKHYNDLLGHPAGDRALRRLAEAMQEEVRVSDVVARYGGEEFGIIMVNTDTDEAREVADRLRRRVEERAFPDEEVQPGGAFTVSAGIATCPRHGSDYEELIRAADEALYRAKRRGKNRVLEA